MPEVEAWIEVAEIDRDLARRANAAPRVIAVGVCFHARHCAEKDRKAVLAETGRAVPRTHDLGMLVRSVMDVALMLADWEGDLRALGPYAVALRYATGLVLGDELLDDAEAAAETMEAGRSLGRTFLGLPGMTAS